MVNPTVDSLPQSGIRNFFDVVSMMEDAISLGVGEPDFVTPWAIREAGIYSLESGQTYYTANSGLMELREEICHYMKRKYDVTYDAKTQVLVSVGGSEAIDAMIRSVICPGDEVLIPEPCFVCYKPLSVMAGGVPVTIETKEEDNFRLTPEQLKEKITDKTKLLILPFPNNPTGGVMSKSDLEAIAEVLKGTDILVLSDEIYAELLYSDEPHTPFSKIDGMYDRTVVVNGFSKAFAMTGWRLGYACGPREIIGQMTKIHQFAIMCAPTTSQYAAVEALKNGDEDVKEMRTAYNQRRRFLMNAFKEMGLECFEPYGAFYVFPCIKEFGMTSDEFATRFLEEEKVAVVPGTAFGDSGEGFLRISYAYSLENLKVAIGRLERFVNKLRAEQKK